MWSFVVYEFHLSKDVGNHFRNTVESVMSWTAPWDENLTRQMRGTVRSGTQGPHVGPPPEPRSRSRATFSPRRAGTCFTQTAPENWKGTAIPQLP